MMCWLRGSKKGSESGSLMTYWLKGRNVGSRRSEWGWAMRKGKSFWWAWLWIITRHHLMGYYSPTHTCGPSNLQNQCLAKQQNLHSGFCPLCAALHICLQSFSLDSPAIGCAMVNVEWYKELPHCTLRLRLSCLPNSRSIVKSFHVFLCWNVSHIKNVSNLVFQVAFNFTLIFQNSLSIFTIFSLRK